MDDRTTARNSLLLVLAVALPVLALRFFTPYELQETDQGKQAQYALDAFQNCSWLAPGCLGDAATKPPLYTWLAAVVSALVGHISETTIRVPTILAALGLVLVTWDIGRGLAGPRVAAAAAIALVTSHHFVRLAGVVRTDGLLAFLVAAQVLVYVRSMRDETIRLSSVIASSALVAAGCMTKGPAALVACGTVALHLLLTKAPRRIWLLAGVPALVGVATLAAWFVAAGETRSDVFDTMVGNELAKHVAHEGFPNPAYYLLHTPPRLWPWTIPLLAAVVIAVISARRSPGPPEPIVTLALAWFLVSFWMFSFVSHQRPDLFYPAEPAAVLLVGCLVRETFPAWIPRAVAALLILAAAILVTIGGGPILPEEAPAFLATSLGALLLATAAGALFVARRNAAVACFVALAGVGFADVVTDTVGRTPEVEQASYAAFAATARAEAAARGARLIAAGFSGPAPLFDLGISTRSLPATFLKTATPPFLVVAAAEAIAQVEEVLGRCDVLARHVARTNSRETLVLLAPRENLEHRVAAPMPAFPR